MSDAFMSSVLIKDDGFTEFEEVLPNLRWRNGVLQQAHRRRVYQYGTPHKETIEWRAVPTEDGP